MVFADTRVLLVAGWSTVSHVAALAVVFPGGTWMTNRQEVMPTGQEVTLVTKSSHNLREFLGRPGPMETCKTFPLGFKTASSP